MDNTKSAFTPGWLDRKEFPFEPHYFETPAGKMHYLDEGPADPEAPEEVSGPVSEKDGGSGTSPVVFVHGNPSWSFEFRHLIKELTGLSSAAAPTGKNSGPSPSGSSIHRTSGRRCIAPDHIGFGLSDKPPEWTYLPEDHAKNIEAFMDSLELPPVTLVVGDWGGPIGLSYAIAHPERVRALLIYNTWLWSVRGDWYYQAFSRFTGGPVGRFLIQRRNFFARDIMRAVYGNKKKLTPEIHAHYLGPLTDPLERKGCWIFPRQIVGSSEWLSSLWSRAAVLRDKKICIAWGMKDIAFREKELKTFEGLFPQARVLRFPDAGHYLPEEKPEELAAEIERL